MKTQHYEWYTVAFSKLCAPKSTLSLFENWLVEQSFYKACFLHYVEVLFSSKEFKLLSRNFYFYGKPTRIPDLLRINYRVLNFREPVTTQEIWLNTKKIIQYFIATLLLTMVIWLCFKKHMLLLVKETSYMQSLIL